MSYDLTGKLHVVFPEKQVSEKFKVREFVVELASGMYNEYPKFQVVQERCALLDSFNAGDAVKVYFDLRGRQYTGRDGNVGYMTSLQAWRIESAGQSEAVTPPPAANAGNSNFDDIDEVPF
ncbi:hypothetical protein MASR2M18_01140 [Ignavibacteria bacterium]|jgi:hypothetical protein|nr:DUF3127 domain-containing protein [Bacteroidota bacterium]MCZ2132157.1 DUF3127 domain-containing protein [Bacteroidota bacterium]